MNVFIDTPGHQDLYYTFYKLFEKRLGYKLYRPNGDESWTDKNIYHVNHLPEHVLYGKTQYEFVKTFEYEDHTLLHNIFDDSYHRLISFQKFKLIKFDIIISTIWQNEIPFYNLHKSYHPNSIYIRHIANIIEQPSVAKNVIAGILTQFESDINYIRHHPEHGDRFFYDPNIKPDKIIQGSENYLCPTGYQGSQEIYDIWKKYESVLTDFEFRYENSYWHNFPKNIQNSKFFWHTKFLGCCGYTGRQALFCGKPLIVNKQYCRIYNTLALEYLKDGVNCIDIDPNLRSFEENIEIIREWSKDDVYKNKCESGLKYTKEKINFDEESEKIKNWINKL